MNEKCNFTYLGMGKFATEFISASNIEHPGVIPRDVLFRPVSGGF